MPKVSMYELEHISDEPQTEKIRTKQNKENKPHDKKVKWRREKITDYLEDEDF